MADGAKKPGYKSTEFWLSLVAMLVGAYAASGALESTATEWDDRIVGLVMTGLAALGYTAARAFTKSSDAKAEAIKSLPPK